MHYSINGEFICNNNTLNIEGFQNTVIPAPVPNTAPVPTNVAVPVPNTAPVPTNVAVPVPNTAPVPTNVAVPVSNTAPVPTNVAVPVPSTTNGVLSQSSITNELNLINQRLLKLEFPINEYPKESLYNILNAIVRRLNEINPQIKKSETNTNENIKSINARIKHIEEKLKIN